MSVSDLGHIFKGADAKLTDHHHIFKFKNRNPGGKKEKAAENSRGLGCVKSAGLA